MDATDTNRSAPEIEIYAPQRSAKTVGEARCAFVVETVSFTKDEGDAYVGFG